MRQLDPRLAALLAPQVRAPRIFQAAPYQPVGQAQQEAQVDAVAAPPAARPPVQAAPPAPPRRRSFMDSRAFRIADAVIGGDMTITEARDAQDARDAAIAEAARRRAIVQQAFPNDPVAQIAAESNWEEFGKQLAENFGVDIAAGGSTIMSRGRQTVAPKVDQFDDRAGVTTMTDAGPVTQYTAPRSPTFAELSQDQERRTKSLAQGGILVTTPPESGMAPASPSGALPRGLRNNNPLNIEDGAFTRSQPGYAGREAQGRFATFQTPEQGAAAADRLLGSYIQRGFDTPAEIIGRWAPSSENGASTGNYANYVARRLGIGPNDPVTPDKVPLLRQAMSEFENGQQQGQGQARVVAENPRPQGAERDAPSGYRWNGENLEPIPGGPADPNASRTGLRPIPAPIVRAIADNRSSVSRIDRALAAIDKYPDGLGAANLLGDFVRQRTDPAGIDVRASVADIGSQIIHDRSGAAVTISESPRLRPFIPQPWDEPSAARTKLRRLRAELQSMNAEIEGFYTPEQGYRGIPAPAPVVSTPPVRRPSPPTRAAPARPAQRPAAPAQRPAAPASRAKPISEMTDAELRALAGSR